RQRLRALQQAQHLLVQRLRLLVALRDLWLEVDARLVAEPSPALLLFPPPRGEKLDERIELGLATLDQHLPGEPVLLRPVEVVRSQVAERQLRLLRRGIVAYARQVAAEFAPL